MDTAERGNGLTILEFFPAATTCASSSSQGWPRRWRGASSCPTTCRLLPFAVWGRKKAIQAWVGLVVQVQMLEHFYCIRRFAKVHATCTNCPVAMPQTMNAKAATEGSGRRYCDLLFNAPSQIGAVDSCVASSRLMLPGSMNASIAFTSLVERDGGADAGACAVSSAGGDDRSNSFWFLAVISRLTSPSTLSISPVPSTKIMLSYSTGFPLESKKPCRRSPTMSRSTMPSAPAAITRAAIATSTGELNSIFPSQSSTGAEDRPLRKSLVRT
mmetsp:Transcript_17086/g.47332  ORF Transcript_17086/g.47332 Transcript_17086/m.47332 type:complete len:271 (-) Transcript_17086:981-1793(-)